MKTIHFICTVEDSIYGYEEVGSVYCDVSTFVKAEKHFRKDPFIKKYIGKDRYRISFRANSVIIQDIA